MANVALRFNLDAEEVELTVDGEVAMSSGQDVFHSWVGAFNEKHKTVDEPVEEKVVPTEVETPPVKVDEPVEEKTTEDESE